MLSCCLLRLEAILVFSSFYVQPTNQLILYSFSDVLVLFLSVITIDPALINFYLSPFSCSQQH